MNKPQRPNSHIIETKSEKYLQAQLPDEWVSHDFRKDYGIDYTIEIAADREMTGLNFSIQLKSTHASKNHDYCSIQLKQTTLNYYEVRLEPVMLVCYVDTDMEAYWVWIDDLHINLSKKQSTYSIQIPKSNALSKIDWKTITEYVQAHFNKRKLVGPFDIMKLNDLERTAWRAYYTDEHDQAVYLFRTLLKSDPQNIQAKQALAWSLYLQFDYPEALRVVNDITQSDTTPKTYQVKGCILAELGIRNNDKGMLIQARDIFQQYIASAPNGLSYYNYANVLSRLDNYEEALKMYKSSIALIPNDARIWKNLGTCYHHLKNFEEEIKCYDKALSIDPNLVQALVAKGVTLTSVYEQHDEALTLFKKALKQEEAIQRDFIHAYFYIAHAYEKKGHITDAIKWLNKGLALAPSDKYLLARKSMILGRNWQSSGTIKAAAATFFSYRFELLKDLESLYYVIKTKDLQKEQAFELIKKEVHFLNNIDLAILEAYHIDWEDILKVLPYWAFYADFRHQYPLTRYSQHITQPSYSIPQVFFSLLGLTFAISFSNAGNRHHETTTGESIPRAIAEIIYRRMPTLIKALLPEKEYPQEIAVEIFAFLLTNFPIVAEREIGLQCVYIETNWGISSPDPFLHIPKDLKKQCFDNVMEELNRRLDLMKD